jgi:hypothetical protein
MPIQIQATRKRITNATRAGHGIRFNRLKIEVGVKICLKNMMRVKALVAAFL